MKYGIISVVIILIVTGCVFSLSTSQRYASGRLSEKIAISINQEIIEATGYAESSVQEIEMIIRKLAHLVVYLMLSTTVLIAVKLHLKSVFIAVMISFLLTALVPFIDELLIQRIARGRSPRLLDIYIDFLGIGLGLVVGFIYLKIGTKLTEVRK